MSSSPAEQNLTADTVPAPAMPQLQGGVEFPSPGAAAEHPPRPFERREVLKAAVDIAAPEQILSYVSECAEKHRACAVVGISAPYATALASDSEMKAAFLSADILIPDGQGFVWGARLLGVPTGARMAIPDLCEELLEEGGRRGWKVFLYGATEELNAKAVADLKARFPGLKAVEGQHGYGQGPAEEDALIKRLKEDSFNLIIVGRPSPDKEKFLARCCTEARLAGIAAGGYIDILAGAKKRAPGFVQALGMEWAYRVAQDPRKLWKRIGWANLKFASSVAWNLFLGVPRRPIYALPWFQVLVIIAAVAVGYSRSLNAPYHFDDPEYILRNVAIRSFSGVSEITVLAHRKLWWLSNALCYKLSEWFGNHTPYNPDVRIFRLFNIACHLIAALGLYGLVRRCLKARAATDVPDPQERFFDVRPFAAAAIFAAHPLATESVTYISGRDNGMGGMFYLLGLYCSAIAFERLGQTAQGSGARTGQWPRWFWPGMLTLIFGACAILTKESYLTYAIAVGLVYFCFYRRTRTATVSGGLLLGALAALAVLGWGMAQKNDGGLWIAMPPAIALLTVGGLLGGPEGPSSGTTQNLLRRRIGMLWAMLIVAAGLGIVSIVALPYAYTRTMAALTGYQGSSYVRSLCCQAYAVPWMLLRTVFPIEVTFNPQFDISHSLNIDHQFPTISDPSDPRVLWGGAILLILFAVGVFGAFRGWLLSFGILLALLSIAPSNSVFERGDIVSERNFYLAAAGGACALAGIMGACAALLAGFTTAADPAARAQLRRSETATWAFLLACCVAGPFVSFTLLRNNEWNSPYRLWDSARKHSPFKMRALYNFGVAAQGLNRIGEAESAYMTAIQVGSSMSERGDFRPDETVDLKCFHLAYARLGDIFLQRYLNSERDDAKSLSTIREIYDKGLTRTAYDPDLALTYADFLIKIGQPTEAIPILQHSLGLHSGMSQVYFPLGIGLLEDGRFADALYYLDKAAQLKDEHSLGYQLELPAADHARIMMCLGLAKLRVHDLPGAQAAFRDAFKSDPDAAMPVVLAFNAAHNLKLLPLNSQNKEVSALSICRQDLLTLMVAAARDLIATGDPKLSPNLPVYAKVFSDELRRREDYRRKRKEFGFKDEPETDD